MTAPGDSQEPMTNHVKEMVMVNANLPQTSGSSDWRDQIEGLVRKPEDHVYGKTALTPREWRKVAHSRRKQKFVVLFESTRLERRVDSVPDAWQNAMGSFAYGVWVKPGFYHPHSGMRLSVMAETEWQRVRPVNEDDIDKSARRIDALRTAADLERDGDQQ